MRITRKRGFILVLAILFLALFELLAISVAMRVPQGVRQAARLGDETAAYLAAEAGVQDTIAWLEYQLKQGVNPVIERRHGNLGLAQWTVDIQPDEFTLPTGNHSCRCYKLLASGQYATMERKLKTSILQESFGRYARFFNHWPATLPPEQTVYFYAGPIYVNGPVHSNEYLWVAAYDAFYTGAYPHKKLFDTDWVSCVKDVVKGPGYPGDDAQLEMIYSTRDPDKAPRKVEKIEPPNLIHLLDMARGSQEYQILPEVSLDSKGGVYIAGNLDDLQFVGNTQIYQLGANKIKVQQDLDQVKWSINGGPEQSFAGHLNGLIYVAGDVSGLHGQVAGNYTLVTDTDPSVAAQRSVTLTGNVTCPAPYQLGIITDHLHLPDYTRLKRIPYAPAVDPNAVSLDACVYMIGKDGYGGFKVDDMVTSPPRLGELTIRGCLIEGQRQRCADVGVQSGWNIVVDHDGVDVHNPAPFFPALPKFDITAIETESR